MTPGIDGKFDLEWGASFPLEGSIQTVPRAELFTILILLRNLQHSASAFIVSDSLVNINLFHRGKTHALASTNGDLWVGVFKEIENKCLDITIKWIQGHLDTKDGTKWFPPLWCALNDGADMFANIAAKSAELPSEIVIAVQLNCSLVTQIQKKWYASFALFQRRPEKYLNPNRPR